MLEQSLDIAWGMAGDCRGSTYPHYGAGVAGGCRCRLVGDGFEVCGNVRRLFVKAHPLPLWLKGNAAPRSDQDGNRLRALFLWVDFRDALLSAGVDGIYRIETNGTAHFAPLPTFKRVGDR